MSSYDEKNVNQRNSAGRVARCPVDGQRLYDLDIESPGHEQKRQTSTKVKSPALNRVWKLLL